MAMIKCPECGKEFSDKAPACPNCGCPISEVIKSASSENERKAAADKMIAAVNRAMEKARKAGAAFEVDSQDIQKMTKENQIDLNSAAAASTVGMLVRTAASACDRQYYAYQNLIPELEPEREKMTPESKSWREMTVRERLAAAQKEVDAERQRQQPPQRKHIDRER